MSTDEKLPSSLSSISFSSAGYLGVYHFGVAAFLQAHYDLSTSKLWGCSAGSLAASVVCFGLNSYEFAEALIQAAATCGRDISRMLPSLESVLHERCPHDKEILQQTEKRLHVALTQVELCRYRAFKKKPRIINTFSSRLNLLQTIRATCHIPAVGGLSPIRIKIHDRQQFFYDGMLTVPHPHPEQGERETLFISYHPDCQCGCTHNPNRLSISPSCKIHPIWVLHPPPTPLFRCLFILGYLDAMRILKQEKKPIHHAPYIQSSESSLFIHPETTNNQFNLLPIFPLLHKANHSNISDSNESSLQQPSSPFPSIPQPFDELTDEELINIIQNTPLLSLKTKLPLTNPAFILRLNKCRPILVDLLNQYHDKTCSMWNGKVRGFTERYVL